MGRRIGEAVVKLDAERVHAYLSAFANECLVLASWIGLNVARDSETVALNNILTCSHTYIMAAAHNLEGHISIIALASRNIYELMLRVRDIMGSSEGLKVWEAEAFTDHIELMEALLKLDNTGSAVEARSSIHSQIASRRAYMKANGIQSKKIEATAELAKRVGKKNDHDVFFKYLSKLVHPTSFLVNAPSVAGGEVNREILLTYLQLCAWDVYCNIQQRFGAPKVSDSLTSFWPVGGPSK